MSRADNITEKFFQVNNNRDLMGVAVSKNPRNKQEVARDLRVKSLDDLVSVRLLGDLDTGDLYAWDGEKAHHDKMGMYGIGLKLSECSGGYYRPRSGKYSICAGMRPDFKCVQKILSRTKEAFS